MNRESRFDDVELLRAEWRSEMREPRALLCMAMRAVILHLEFYNERIHNVWSMEKGWPTFLRIFHRLDIDSRTVDRRWTAHQPQHRRVYCPDRDCDDFLESKCMWEVNEARRSLTQNSKWKVEWNNNVAGVHRSVTAREKEKWNTSDWWKNWTKDRLETKTRNFLFVHSPNGKMFHLGKWIFHLGFVQKRRSSVEVQSKDIRVSRGQHFPNGMMEC